jgi:trans-2,3-dihydro-3-hydroxyanthranilate isomerase
MHDHPFVTMDVFTDRRFGGNQLAIFPQGDVLTPDEMQVIAAELNISETIFLLPGSGDTDTRVRIFTPRAELPFAGHPLIGAAIYLSGVSGRDSVEMSVAAGKVTARVTHGNAGPAEATLVVPSQPERGPRAELAAAADVLGLSTHQVAFAPETYSAGIPYTFVPLVDRAALSEISFDVTTWSECFKNSWAPAIFAFTMQDWSSSADVHGRMFAPGIGISEDPATGSAAAALAGLFARLQRVQSKETAWTLYQGEDMGRPSRIDMAVSRSPSGDVTIRITGGAVEVIRGTLTTKAF